MAIDGDLLERFDQLNARRGYANRSEAFRDLIRNELAGEATMKPSAHVVGTLTLIYDHNVRQLADRLTDMQHEHHREIVSTLHVHLDAHNCLEVLVLRGRCARVREIADRLIATKGVQQGRLTLAVAGHAPHGHSHTP